MRKKSLGHTVKKQLQNKYQKHWTLTPVIDQDSTEKGQEEEEKGLGYCFLYYKGFQHSSTFKKHGHVIEQLIWPKFCARRIYCIHLFNLYQIHKVVIITLIFRWENLSSEWWSKLSKIIHLGD